jgi:hypothetical protein
MLHHCPQRWEDLQHGLLDTKPGTIVAVGDPAYEKPLMRLKGTREEVNIIEKLFGKEHVKKLVGPEATPSEVLKWAKYPSENHVKQVIFHIAAHGIGQNVGRKVKQGAIILARPASSCQENCGKRGIYGLLFMAKADMLTFSYLHVWFIAEHKLFAICRKKIVMRRKCAMLVWVSTAYGYSM